METGDSSKPIVQLCSARIVHLSSSAKLFSASVTVFSTFRTFWTFFEHSIDRGYADFITVKRILDLWETFSHKFSDFSHKKLETFIMQKGKNCGLF